MAPTADHGHLHQRKPSPTPLLNMGTYKNLIEVFVQLYCKGAEFAIGLPTAQGLLGPAGDPQIRPTTTFVTRPLFLGSTFEEVSSLATLSRTMVITKSF
jgi:hypothetical protein